MCISVTVNFCWWTSGSPFGDDSTPPGIDVICPDVSALRSVREQIVGIVITHAHEDHVGALHYLWNQLKAPVYCTPFTASVARRKLGEAGLLDQVPLHEVLPGSHLQLGCFDLEWVTLTHSIPEPNALVIQTAGAMCFSYRRLEARSPPTRRRSLR
jgi:ribonuclease J